MRVKCSSDQFQNLGWVLLASGNPRESILEFEAALQLNPELKAAAEGLRQA